MAAEDGPPRGLILRVDDRLLHGQVIIGWGKGWPADEVWLVSDRIAADEFERKLYCDTIPGSIHGGVLKVADAIENWKSGISFERKVIGVVETCRDLHTLIFAGIRPTEVHLGSISCGENRVKIAESIFLNDEERRLLIEVRNRGVRTVCRPLPASAPHLVPLEEFE